MNILKGIEQYAEDEKFQSKWQKIKFINKKKLASWILHKTEIEIDPNTLFDVQIKRIHEYKRQFMNILYVIYRYLSIKEMKPEERAKVVPRTVMFGGKAAPAY